MNPIIALVGTFVLYTAAKRRLSKYVGLINSQSSSATNPAKGAASDAGSPRSASEITAAIGDKIKDMLGKVGK